MEYHIESLITGEHSGVRLQFMKLNNKEILRLDEIGLDILSPIENLIDGDVQEFVHENTKRWENKNEKERSEYYSLVKEKITGKIKKDL